MKFIELDHGVNLYSAGPGQFAYRSPKTDRIYPFRDPMLSARRMALMSALLDIDLSRDFRASLPADGNWLTLTGRYGRSISFPLANDPQHTLNWLRQQLGVSP